MESNAESYVDPLIGWKFVEITPDGSALLESPIGIRRRYFRLLAIRTDAEDREQQILLERIAELEERNKAK